MTNNKVAERILNLLRRIPKGSVVTYGQIAQLIGHPKSARMIGRILNMNPKPIIIPCHRVVGSRGDLLGYKFGPDKKRELLQKEGVRFIGNRVDLNKSQVKRFNG